MITPPGDKSRSISQYSLPERITYLRDRKSFTQSALAKSAGLSQSTIAQIEKGRKDPSINTLLKISEALDVHLAVLFATEEVHVFDMARLKKNYNHVDKLNETLYSALGRVIRWAQDIGFLK